MTAGNRLAVILVLGTTQTLGWASSFLSPGNPTSSPAPDPEEQEPGEGARPGCLWSTDESFVQIPAS